MGGTRADDALSVGATNDRQYERKRSYSRYPLMYHPHARTAMQEKVGYKRPRRDQK